MEENVIYFLVKDILVIFFDCEIENKNELCLFLSIMYFSREWYYYVYIYIY